ncbi:hypothetical protein D3C79_915030 [compost metagenome]
MALDRYLRLKNTEIYPQKYPRYPWMDVRFRTAISEGCRVGARWSSVHLRGEGGGTFLQLLEQVRHSPHVTFERAGQHTFEEAGNLSVRHCVAREVDNLIAEARFEENDFRCQRTDVVWRRERHAGLKTA